MTSQHAELGIDIHRATTTPRHPGTTPRHLQYKFYHILRLHIYFGSLTFSPFSLLIYKVAFEKSSLIWIPASFHRLIPT